MALPARHLLAGFPPSVSPSSHAVESDGWVFLTGQFGRDRQNVVSVRVFLRRFKEDYAAMNEVYAQFFPVGERPARTCVGVIDLAPGARIELDCIARRP